MPSQALFLKHVLLTSFYCGRSLDASVPFVVADAVVVLALHDVVEKGMSAEAKLRKMEEEQAQKTNKVTKAGT